MTTGMKFDVIIKDYPFPIGKNLSRNDAEDMVKRKGGKVVPAGSKK
tara:strand:+ start:340 stop:477 length:138 start_codon:yes stop_codon:yes gene_type:complete